MSRPILLAALALSMFGCVGSPTEPGNAAGSKSSSAANGPNFSGDWSGTFAVDDCRQSREIALQNICGALGKSGPYRLRITQNNQGATVTPTVGTIQFPSTTVKAGSDGGLDLQTSTISNGFNVVAQWALFMNDAALSGTLYEIWTSPTLMGKVTVGGTITTAVRSTQ